MVSNYPQVAERTWELVGWAVYSHSPVITCGYGGDWPAFLARDSCVTLIKGSSPGEAPTTFPFLPICHALQHPLLQS